MRFLTPSLLQVCVRILRVVAWNLLLIIAALVVIAATGETYVRLSKPFERRDNAPPHFVPGVGLIYEPGGEDRWTNHQEVWNISRANSQGFLDREPISPERAAESCHITIIGDSFVAGREIPRIEDKLQVQLEELAAQALPELNVTTSAFGIHSTGQINHLPIYDRYARKLSPKLLVLVFTHNDLWDSSATLHGLLTGWDPDRAPYTFAERAADGTMKLRPPSPHYEPFLVDNRTWVSRALLSLRWSEFAAWLERKLPKSVTRPTSIRNVISARVELLKQRPRYATIHDGWTSVNGGQFWALAVQDDPPPVFREGREFAAFALDEFAERARRDGADLIILSTHTMGDRNARHSILLDEIVGTRGIPVINQHEYIIAQGANVEDAHFVSDPHWNLAGHQWAAEALLEYLKQNQGICDTMDMTDAERTQS